MGVVNFTVTIFGGIGNLKITFDRSPAMLLLDQNNPGPLPVTLPQDVNNYTVEGNAPPGGSIHLDVTGDLAAADSKDFGPGPIFPQTFPIFVTK